MNDGDSTLHRCRVGAPRWVAAWLISAASLLVGCQATPYELKPIKPVGELPAYNELVERYNANLANLDRLWSRADVTINFRDQKNRKQSERADNSVLMTVPPNDVALALGNIAGSLLWAGCDDEQYWAFYLKDDKPLYFGRRDRVSEASTQPLPSLVRVYPQQVPRMLGLVTLTPLPPGLAPPVQWHNGYLLIEPPGESTRLYIDPVDAMPRGIDLLDEAGQTVVAVRLTDHKPISIKDLAVAERPRIASRIEAWVLNEDVKLTIKLGSMSDGRADRAKDRAFGFAFDFEKLIQTHKPGQVIDLDADP